MKKGKKVKQKRSYNIGGNKPNLAQRILSYFCVMVSFWSIDWWLRLSTNEIGRYPFFSWEPHLFTFFYGTLLSVIIFAIQKKKVQEWVYSIVFYCSVALAFVQYGSYVLVGKFMTLSEFGYMGEGAHYFGFAVKQVGIMTFVWAGIFYMIGHCIKMFFLPNTIVIKKRLKKKAIVVRCAIAAGCITGILLTPRLYKEEKGENWEASFDNPAYEYDSFSDAGFDMQLCGYYGYVSRDFQKSVSSKFRTISEEELKKCDEFFAQKGEHKDNSMTGRYKGKNLMVFMMESMDDWLITPEDTPTLYSLKESGIDFTNFYTPDFANGWTFNTELAFNTAIYPKANDNAAYSLVRNNFSNSIANVLRKDGYRANSFHEGLAKFYNRRDMHVTFGYEKFHSYKDYQEDGIDNYIWDYKEENGQRIELNMRDDSYLTQKDELYYDFIGRGENVKADGAPFYSFCITYSPHLPYDRSVTESEIALDRYPQYDENDEFQVARAKARLTDDMVSQLIERLKEDGLYEDTVMVFFADHYTYGIKDKDKLKKISEENGNGIFECTPAFIYCASDKEHIEVTKTSQTVDLGPTVMNLMGVDVPDNLMGNDIFDDSYSGYAIFPNGGWITDKAETFTREPEAYSGISIEEKTQMDEFVKRYYDVRDIILDSNYYSLKRKVG